jgi:hypothetical protein
MRYCDDHNPIETSGMTYVEEGSKCEAGTATVACPS